MVLKRRPSSAICRGFGCSRYGFPDPQIGSNLPRLESIIKDVKCSQVKAAFSPHTRFPITPDILSLIQQSLLSFRDGHMIWAACCTGFFSFLRTAEFTIPSTEHYDATVHLSLPDIALDSHMAPTVLRLIIKASKTDPFQRGPDIFGEDSFLHQGHGGLPG